MARRSRQNLTPCPGVWQDEIIRGLSAASPQASSRKSEPIAGLDRYAGRSRAGTMGFGQKLDAKRLLNGAVLLGAIALAWAIERPQKPAPPVMETYPAGWTVDPRSRSAASRYPSHALAVVARGAARNLRRHGQGPPAGGRRRRGVLRACSRSSRRSPRSCRPMACSPMPSAIQDNLSLLANVLPAGGISIVAGADRAHRAAAERAQHRLRRRPRDRAVERQRRRQGDDRCAQRHRGAGRAPHLRAAQCRCR